MFIHVPRLPGDPRADVLKLSFQEISPGYYDNLVNIAMSNESLRPKIDALRINGKITWGRYINFIREQEAIRYKADLEESRLDLEDSIKYGAVWELIIPTESNVATSCIGSTRIRDRLAKEKRER